MRKYYRERRKRRRRRINKKAVAGAACILALIIAAVVCAVIFIPKLISSNSKMYYIAGTSSDISLYYYDDYDERLLVSSETIVRGTQVKSSWKTFEQNGETYVLIKYDEEEYYVESSALVKEETEIVKETSLWVRTSVTVYENSEDSVISSFISKGNQLNITGYDFLDEDGAVNMYEIEYGAVTGWVYSKYLVETEEEACAVYESVYTNHEGRAYAYELYGGSVDDLDWYPYESVSFESNTLLSEDARVMYLDASALLDIDSYLSLAEENGVNGVVIDIKDDHLTTTFDIAAELSPTSNTNAYMDEETFAAAIEKIKESGLYMIARIVCFDDEDYAADNPDDCIETTVTSAAWVSAFCRNVWYYNVALAEEVIEKYGVNEIMFDYVRFPETAYSMSCEEDTDFKNEYGESKAQALQDFLYYACDCIHRSEVYVSVTLEAETVGKYVMSYGQYWPAFSNVADVICPFALTDNIGTDSSYWSDAYTTAYNWAERAAARQSEVETAAVMRAWVTGYDVPYWSPSVECDAEYVEDNVQGIYDWGLDGGFIIYNEEANLTMYKQLAPAWNISY